MSDPVWTPKDVFISYKREERPRVVLMSEALGQLGLTVWFDAALEPGASFDEEIAREVSAARSVLVCWTNGSVGSRWVRSEATIAANRHVLVPVFLESCDLPPPFNLDHAEDLSDWNGRDDHAGWRKVVSRLGVLAGRGDAPARWLAAQTTNSPAPYRQFLKDFPTDALVAVAKRRIWALEKDAIERRLATELGISAPADPVAELEEIRARSEEQQARVVEAERAERDARREAADAIDHRDRADALRRKAEARASTLKQRTDQEISKSQGGGRSSPKEVPSWWAETETSNRNVVAFPLPLKVFISHKQKDFAAAHRIRQQLERSGGNGIQVFVSGDDRVDRAPHEWRSVILRNLREAHVLIFLYTDLSRRWDWCLYETGYFDGRQDPQQLDRRLYVLHRAAIYPVGPFLGLKTVRVLPKDDPDDRELKSFLKILFVYSTSPSVNEHWDKPDCADLLAAFKAPFGTTSKQISSSGD